MAITSFQGHALPVTLTSPAAPLPKNMDVKLPDHHVPTCTGGTCFVAGTLMIAAGQPPTCATQISLSVAIEHEGPDAPMMETHLRELAGIALIGAGTVI